MRKKTGLFAFIFVTTTMANFLFVDSNDIWGALFVGFFTGLLLAFVFFWTQKPLDHQIKKLTRKYHKTH